MDETIISIWTALTPFCRRVTGRFRWDFSDLTPTMHILTSFHPLSGPTPSDLNRAQARLRSNTRVLSPTISLLTASSSRQVFSIAENALTGEVGCGLYLEAAAANHSCNPNAAQSFSGKTLSLRCTRPIRKGEEITIGITQIQKPGPARRESLRKTYFFECRCER